MKQPTSTPTPGTVFTDGFRQAPPLRLLLGLCPSLAVTTAMENGFWMGLAVIFVLACSELIISLLRKAIPDRVRIPVYIVIVAAFTTIVDMAMKAYLAQMHAILGIYIPLIVVNCIILGRIEAFAAEHPPGRSLADALGYGLGFTWTLTLIGAIRELLGAGTVFGLSVMPAGFVPWRVMLTPAGAFWTMGMLVGVITLWRQRGAVKKAQAGPLRVGLYNGALRRARERRETA